MLQVFDFFSQHARFVFLCILIGWLSRRSFEYTLSILVAGYVVDRRALQVISSNQYTREYSGYVADRRSLEVIGSNQLVCKNELVAHRRTFKVTFMSVRYLLSSGETISCHLCPTNP